VPTITFGGLKKAGRGVLAERIRARAQRVDREPARDRRDDAVVAARLLDAVEHRLLDVEVLGERLEDQVGAGDGLAQIMVVVADYRARRDRGRAHLADRFAEPLFRLCLGAREEDHLGHGLCEQRRAAVAHRAVRAEHDDPLELAAGEQAADLGGAGGSVASGHGGRLFFWIGGFAGRFRPEKGEVAMTQAPSQCDIDATRSHWR
jgi:hypothetical protein